jgi:hypothetical protein
MLNKSFEKEANDATTIGNITVISASSIPSASNLPLPSQNISPALPLSTVHVLSSSLHSKILLNQPSINSENLLDPNTSDVLFPSSEVTANGSSTLVSPASSSSNSLIDTNQVNQKEKMNDDLNA